MDENALEAMIRRQQQAQAGYESGPKAELKEKSDDFEVYERPKPQEPEPVEEAPAAPEPAPEPLPNPEPAAAAPSVMEPQAPETVDQGLPRVFRRPEESPTVSSAPVDEPAAVTPPPTEPTASSIPSHAEQQAAHTASHESPGAGGEGAAIAIVQADFHPDVTDAMASMAASHAKKRGATVPAHLHVPGAFDTPLATKRLLARDDVDGVVVIGCVIQGETAHDEVITHAVAQQLTRLACEFDKPVALGISGPRMTAAQAEARIVMGRNAMDAAIEQALLLRHV